MSYLEDRVFLISKDSELNKVDTIFTPQSDSDGDWEDDVAESYSEALLSAKKTIDSDNVEKVYIYEASEKFHEGERGYDYDEDRGGEYVYKDPDYHTYKAVDSVEITKNKNGIAIKEIENCDSKQWVKQDLDLEIQAIEDDTHYSIIKDCDGSIAMSEKEGEAFHAIDNFVNKNFKEEYRKNLNVVKSWAVLAYDTDEAIQYGLEAGLFRDEADKLGDKVRENINNPKYKEFLNKKGEVKGLYELRKYIAEREIKGVDELVEEKHLKGFNIMGIDSPLRKKAKSELVFLQKNIDSKITEYKELKKEHEDEIENIEKQIKRVNLKQQNLVKKTFISNEDLKSPEDIHKALIDPNQKQSLSNDNIKYKKQQKIKL